MFDGKAKKAIEGEEQTCRQARSPQCAKPVGGEPQDQKHHAAFETRLIELAWVAGQVAGARKHHAPGNRRRPPPELAIDEVGNPAKTQANGRTRRR